jgi:hypothetical protein
MYGVPGTRENVKRRRTPSTGEIAVYDPDAAFTMRENVGELATLCPITFWRKGLRAIMVPSRSTIKIDPWAPTLTLLSSESK